MSSSDRTELSASGSGFEPLNCERWYGFSIYLPDSWEFDPTPESLTQWHHPFGSYTVPLALVTMAGKWWVALKDWTNATSQNESIYIDSDDYVLGKWTDWVVHVRWSANPDGLLEIWKDGGPVTLPNNGGGQNAYAADENQVPLQDGNYMKFGIYKWPWGQSPDTSNTTQRVMYHDEVRIVDGADGRDYRMQVAPPGED